VHRLGSLTACPSFTDQYLTLLLGFPSILVLTTTTPVLRPVPSIRSILIRILVFINVFTPGRSSGSSSLVHRDRVANSEPAGCYSRREEQVRRADQYRLRSSWYRPNSSCGTYIRSCLRWNDSYEAELY